MIHEDINFINKSLNKEVVANCAKNMLNLTTVHRKNQQKQKILNVQMNQQYRKINDLDLKI